jgi:hypothetical protein
MTLSHMAVTIIIIRNLRIHDFLLRKIEDTPSEKT